ncbi:hypothetical protein BTH42_00525 [Burkholderia sp. SRS-W-2-2016]|uniref:hypothetical protein n=1 Tax=Burkholderia sp. SRS-W-2-2016 TaxID=1926878 RepID=UPI00094B0149|nr:hypothetical protein [Burkholderia sp. SRS-W-2-2016]OLL33514.1 hypothetical protein BTH42_00525 [Burkholderia sp. SRS-W-2-2016]
MTTTTFTILAPSVPAGLSHICLHSLDDASGTWFIGLTPRTIARAQRSPKGLLTRAMTDAFRFKTGGRFSFTAAEEPAMSSPIAAKPRRKTVQFNARFIEPMNDELNARAQALGVTPSEIVRTLVAAWLRNPSSVAVGFEQSGATV